MKSYKVGFVGTLVALAIMYAGCGDTKDATKVAKEGETVTFMSSSSTGTSSSSTGNLPVVDRDCAAFMDGVQVWFKCQGDARPETTDVCGDDYINADGICITKPSEDNVYKKECEDACGVWILNSCTFDISGGGC
jgi:hypothetical protein